MKKKKIPYELINLIPINGEFFGHNFQLFYYYYFDIPYSYTDIQIIFSSHMWEIVQTQTNVRTRIPAYFNAQGTFKKHFFLKKIFFYRARNGLS